MCFRFVSSSCFGLLLCASTAFTHHANATPLTGYSAGAGANTATLVVDFGFSGGDAYAFLYRFDGSATSEQMLLALDVAGGLTVHHQFFNFGGGPSIFIDGFTYLGDTAVPVFEGSSGENWSSWTIDTPASTYAPASTGPTDRVLQDGSVDGWSLNVSAFNSQGFDATSTPPALPASVPEPASAALLAIAGLALAHRRRR